MAFNFLFRGISRSLLSPPIRCGRAFEGPISAVRNGENSIRGHLAGGQFLPLLRFSSLQSPVKGIPDDFPFTIVDEIGKARLTLEREYNGAIIKVKVRAFPKEIGRGYGVKTKKWKFDHLLMSVFIHYGDQHSKCISFEVTAFPDPDEPIAIHTLQVSTDDPNGHLEAFEEFLDRRGVNAATIKTMIDYWKEKKEEHKRLSNIGKKLIRVGRHLGP